MKFSRRHQNFSRIRTYNVYNLRPNYNQGPPGYNQGYNQGYGGGMYGNYGNYNSMYGGMKTTLPAADPRPKVKASKTVESEAVVANEEKVEVEES